MKSLLRHSLIVAFTIVTALAFAGRANAHFLWLKTDSADGQPQAVLIFGESSADEAYHLPESLADTKIWCRTLSGKRIELESEYVETDDRVGLVAAVDKSKLPVGEPCVLETVREYGVYGDFLLTYYAKHVHADSNDAIGTAGASKELRLDIVPRATADGLQVTMLWDGKPRGDVSVSFAVGEGEPTKTRTNDAGNATYQPKKSGLVAVLANCTEADKKGSLNGKEYSSAMHYSSLTVPWNVVETFPTPSKKGQESRVKSQEPEKASATSALTPLPEAVSSFGAAVCDGWLYVYSGHTGTEHDHSAANLSQKFLRIKLDGTSDWESLPMQTPLQGLAVVDHDGKVYRIGGMNARNATTDDEEDLHSTTEFAEFDPATNKWTALAPLPAPRSSHKAVVIGDKLYVTGGWTLSGPRKVEWLADSLVYDFANPSVGWQQLPAQSFQRRALAAGEWQGKLFAMGGMDEKAKISRRVDIFDPQTGTWSEGPKLPGAGMSGFGISAWNLDGKLYVSGFRGQVYRLSDDGSEWEEVARLATPRFFHQLVPAGAADALLAVGGASREGHLVDLELIDVSADASSNDASKDQAARDCCSSSRPG